MEASTEKEIDAAKAKYSELTGKSLIFGYLTTTDLSQIGIYAPEDPRVSFMHDLGLRDAPAVASAIKPGEFYGSVSARRPPDLESDVFLTWSEKPGDMKTFTSDQLIGQVPAIADGHAYAEPQKPSPWPSPTRPRSRSRSSSRTSCREVAKAVEGS